MTFVEVCYTKLVNKFCHGNKMQTIGHIIKSHCVCIMLWDITVDNILVSFGKSSHIILFNFHELKVQHLNFDFTRFVSLISVSDPKSPESPIDQIKYTANGGNNSQATQIHRTACTCSQAQSCGLCTQISVNKISHTPDLSSICYFGRCIAWRTSISTIQSGCEQKGQTRLVLITGQLDLTSKWVYTLYKAINCTHSLICTKPFWQAIHSKDGPRPRSKAGCGGSSLHLECIYHIQFRPKVSFNLLTCRLNYT